MKGVAEKALAASDAEVRLVRMLKALGNPIRFQIMKTLAERRTCITQEIVETTPLAQSTVSQHLKVLREAGLIEGEISGPATCYCIDVQGVRWLKEQIERWLPECCAPEVSWGFPSGQEGQRQPGRCC
jgi:ArsR family transcriptional regulator